MPDHSMPEDAALHADVAGHVLGILTPEEVMAFEAHLSGCAECRNEVAELSGLGELLAKAAPPVDVPRHLEDRTFAAIERAAEADEGRPPTVARSHVHHHRRRRTIELRTVLAVAASVLVLGAGIAVVRTVTEPKAAVAEVIELEAPPGRSGSAVARVRTTATGGTIEMEVSGLPQPPAGSFYECWLVAAQGDAPDRPNRVSVGTFTVDADGHAKVRWDFEADTAKFPRMGVTLEPPDGNPAHTTDRVLAAKRLL